MKVSRLSFVAAIIVVSFCFAPASNIQAGDYEVPKPVCKKVCAETKTVCKKGACAETKSVPSQVLVGYKQQCTTSPIPELPDICVDKPIYETTYKEVCVRWEEVCNDVCIRWEEVCSDVCTRWEEVCNQTYCYFVSAYQQHDVQHG